MNSNTHTDPMTLRSKKLRAPSKSTSKPVAKKDFKNQFSKGKANEKGPQKAAAKDQRAVVWKSTRGRTEEKTWSYEEEQKLFALHEQLGNRWAKISRQFTGKTDNDVKNHIFSRFRLGIRRINKIAQSAPTQMRTLKMTVISKIMNVCDSRFTPNTTVSSSLLSNALSLKRGLLAFLYEHPSDSPSPQLQKLIKQLRIFSEIYSKTMKNSQRSSDSEDMSVGNHSESSQQAQPLLDFHKEGESYPTKVQENLLENESTSGRQSNFFIDNILFELSTPNNSRPAADVAILNPDFNSPILVGDPFSLHCVESLLPPIRSDEAYQYDINEGQFELLDFLDFST